MPQNVEGEYEEICIWLDMQGYAGVTNAVYHGLVDSYDEEVGQDVRHYANVGLFSLIEDHDGTCKGCSSNMFMESFVMKFSKTTVVVDGRNGLDYNDLSNYVTIEDPDHTHLIKF